MKKTTITISMLFCGALLSYAQSWVSVNFPSGMVHQAAELNGNLFIADGGNGLRKFDGTTWTLYDNLNNSLNAPNKNKRSVVNIDNLLYCGNDDFNTSGEGNIHTFDGTTFNDFQLSDFPYNGNYKISDFASYGNNVYAAGLFVSPDNTSRNLAKWNGTDWVGVGISTQSEVIKLLTYNSKLYAVSADRIYFYDGSAWDSIPQGGPFLDSYKDAAIWNGTLVVCGNIYIYQNGNPAGTAQLATWDGSSFQTLPQGLVMVNRILSNNGTLFGVVQAMNPDFSNGDVSLATWDGAAWMNLIALQPSTGGVVPGYPLSDYNRIFFYNGDMYVGGRFTNIGGESISGLAKYTGNVQSQLPNAPSDLTATVFKTESGYIQLTWTDNANNEDGFKVQRSTDGQNFTDLTTLAVDAINYDDNAIAENTTYYYQVIAFNTAGNSGPSNQVTVTSGSVGIQDGATNKTDIRFDAASRTVWVDGLTQNDSMEIYAATGSLVKSSTMIHQHQKLSVAELQSGVYLIKTSSSIKKILIQ